MNHSNSTFDRTPFLAASALVVHTRHATPPPTDAAGVTDAVVLQRVHHDAGTPGGAERGVRSPAERRPAVPWAPPHPDGAPTRTNNRNHLKRSETVVARPSGGCCPGLEASGSTCTCGPDIFGPTAWQDLSDRLRLSGRELEVVRGIFGGAKEAVIARDSGMSPHTVHEHIRRLHRKLGARDRVEVVLAVVRCALQR